VRITPPVGSRLVGQFDERIMVDVHDHLYARAMVVDDGASKVALVSCDLLSLRRSTVARARELIGELAGLPGQHVMISATHTHDGPVVAHGDARGYPEPYLASGFTTPVDDEYLAMLPRWIASAVCLASRGLVEARVGSGSGREERATFNRRYLAADGTVRMHGSAPDGVEIVGPEGPTDPEVGVLFAEDADGNLLSALVNYTCHPTAAGHELSASADYCGYLTGTVARGKQARGEVLFVNGAYANVGPVGRYSPDRREYGFGRAEYVGTLVGAEAVRAIEAAEPEDAAPLRVLAETVELPIREIDDDALASARAVLADRTGGLIDRVCAQEVLLLGWERRQRPTVPAEVQVIALGDTALVGIPAELFVEFGLEIKRRSPFRRTFVAGGTNGMVGYVPTEVAFRNGGYEARLKRNSKCVPAAGATLVDTALRLLERVRG
jgi:hypothetical protein